MRLRFPCSKIRQGRWPTDYMLCARQRSLCSISSGSSVITAESTINTPPAPCAPSQSKNDLRQALDELLAGKPVSQPDTKVVGCLIGRCHTPDEKCAVTYANQIAPLLEAALRRMPSSRADCSLLAHRLRRSMRLGRHDRRSGGGGANAPVARRSRASATSPASVAYRRMRNGLSKPGSRPARRAAIRRTNRPARASWCSKKTAVSAAESSASSENAPSLRRPSNRPGRSLVSRTPCFRCAGRRLRCPLKGSSSTSFSTDGSGVQGGSLGHCGRSAAGKSRRSCIM